MDKLCALHYMDPGNSGVPHAIHMPYDGDGIFREEDPEYRAGTLVDKRSRHALRLRTVVTETAELALGASS